MEIKMEKKDWLFLLLCLITGIVAEEAFFRDMIGISYFVFIVVFYSLFFWRFRSFTFTHQRLGWLILIVIWFLAADYYLYTSSLFYMLNIIVIPSLVVFHLTLITSPKKLEWNNLYYISYVFQRLFEGIRYSALFTNHLAGIFKKNGKEKRFDTWKKILIGIAISIPFLFIILNLLIEADSQFERIVGKFPDLFTFREDLIIRFVIILIFTFSFFGFMQVLLHKKMVLKNVEYKPITLDGIITLTVLALLDLVYIIFVAVQFKYFFSGTLGDGFTYAEYARRGFFELLFVTLINITVTTAVIYFTNGLQGALKKVINLALTILVFASGVILISAMMRMTMYEDAYGFTFTRVLAHSFMIFLLIIFAYTLVKIWLEKLSLFHFYFIASLIYYAGINTVNLDQIVVNKNIDRYETTGKIDINYLNYLSETGILGLIELHEKNPDIPGLKDLLIQHKSDGWYKVNSSWQSKNLTRDKLDKKLGEINLQ